MFTVYSLMLSLIKEDATEDTRVKSGWFIISLVYIIFIVNFALLAKGVWKGVMVVVNWVREMTRSMKKDRSEQGMIDRKEFEQVQMSEIGGKTVHELSFCDESNLFNVRLQGPKHVKRNTMDFVEK